MCPWWSLHWRFMGESEVYAKALNAHYNAVMDADCTAALVEDDRLYDMACEKNRIINDGVIDARQDADRARDAYNEARRSYRSSFKSATKEVRLLGRRNLATLDAEVNKTGDFFDKLCDVKWGRTDQVMEPVKTHLQMVRDDIYVIEIASEQYRQAKETKKRENEVLAAKTAKQGLFGVKLQSEAVVREVLVVPVVEVIDAVPVVASVVPVVPESGNENAELLILIENTEDAAKMTVTTAAAEIRVVEVFAKNDVDSIIVRDYKRVRTRPDFFRAM